MEWTPTRTGSAGALVTEMFAFVDGQGQSRYDENVTQVEHAIQCGLLAQGAAADESLVVAALFHDIGHLLLGEHDADPAFPDRDLRHEAVGARFLARWFGPAVAAPVGLHVRAKRYLVSVDPGYAELLSQASRRSLAVQGGPLEAGEVAAFAAAPFALAAVRLRRWDDEAKVSGRRVPPLSAFVDVVSGQLRLG